MDSTGRSSSRHVHDQSSPLVKRFGDIQRIASNEMAVLAETEYARLFELLESLTGAEWASPTVCGDWDVRRMVAHLLGAAESNASIAESLRQGVKGSRRARRMSRPQIDGIKAIQVEERDHLGPLIFLMLLKIFFFV